MHKTIVEQRAHKTSLSPKNLRVGKSFAFIERFFKATSYAVTKTNKTQKARLDGQTSEDMLYFLAEKQQGRLSL